MIEKRICIEEKDGINRVHEPLCFGVPFAVQELLDLSLLKLICDDKQQIAQFKSLATWMDGSVQWLLVEIQISLKKHQKSDLRLIVTDKKNDDIETGIRFKNSLTEIYVFCGKHTFIINKKFALPFLFNPEGNSLVEVPKCKLITEYGEFTPEITSIKLPELPTKVSATFKFFAEFKQIKELNGIKLIIKVKFFSQGSLIKIDCCLHNSLSADHQHGKWDLGDNNSLIFKELHLCWANTSKKIKIQPESLKDWLTFPADSDLQLYQESSGGKNWNCDNHLSSAGKINLSFNGFKIYNNEKIIGSGLRAEPIFLLSSDRTMQFYLEHFWQNFPSAVKVTSEYILIKLFPNNFPEYFELQPGEKKNQSIFISNSKSENALSWTREPLTIHINENHFFDSGVIPWLSKNNSSIDYMSLINASLEGESNFFAKREIIDEYGWRNFGDLYADHEAIYKQDNKAFISHYNNQYDAIYSFACQFIQTGNRRWFTLMEDLAKHVVDIDIYHTDCDRSEYNGGLFWHTDHYLPARTTTHRTFSRHHHLDKGNTFGGGPGTEHCYSTGLLLHYYLTGNNNSKEAVKSLVNWMVNIEEGNGTILERIFLFKKKNIGQIKQLIQHKKVLNYHYPLTRGTGNYISTLIDGYKLTKNKEYLQLCERVITQTLGPTDDINDRHLDDVESRWSYLVALQALAKYMHLKESNGEINDDHYLYAKASLIHYCDWIKNNERPFLDSKEQLDYPNDTWAAQDLRKANLLFIAARYSPQKRVDLLKKAEYFKNYVITHLQGSPQKELTRILILLLQNSLPLSLLDNSCEATTQPAKTKQYSPPEYLTISKVLLIFFSDVFQCLKNFSLNREKSWLNTRLSNNNKNSE